MDSNTDKTEVDQSTDPVEKCLTLIGQLYSQGSINDDQRDTLKDMLFEDDATLLSFFERYAEDDDYDGLKESIKKYCGANNNAKPEEQTTDADNIEQMSSPMDSGIDMKKRKRLAALAKQNKQAAEQEQKKQEEAETSGAGGKGAGFKIGQQDCDLGMSPQVMKGSVFRKDRGGGGLTSPIVHADKFKLGRR